MDSRNPKAESEADSHTTDCCQSSTAQQEEQQEQTESACSSSPSPSESQMHKKDDSDCLMSNSNSNSNSDLIRNGNGNGRNSNNNNNNSDRDRDQDQGQDSDRSGAGGDSPIVIKIENKQDNSMLDSQTNKSENTNLNLASSATLTSSADEQHQQHQQQKTTSNITSECHSLSQIDSSFSAKSPLSAPSPLPSPTKSNVPSNSRLKYQKKQQQSEQSEHTQPLTTALHFCSTSPPSSHSSSPQPKTNTKTNKDKDKNKSTLHSSHNDTGTDTDTNTNSSSIVQPNNKHSQHEHQHQQHQHQHNLLTQNKKFPGLFQGISHTESSEDDEHEHSDNNHRDQNHTNQTSNRRSTTETKTSLRPPLLRSKPLEPAILSLEDIEICQKLDDEYERALEEREIAYSARYDSVRQSAFLSVFIMLIILAVGTWFYMNVSDWDVPDALLFSIYTITTVGYSVQSVPSNAPSQIFTIFYIFIGIATLTIMVAQVYQCIALEASRAQHSRDKTEIARKGLDTLSKEGYNNSRGNVHGETTADEIITYHQHNLPGIVDYTFRLFDRAKHFFRHNDVGRGVSVVFPFAGLILIGAIVVGPIEGWSLVEAIYFSVVSLTTVGFGDYYPTKRASVWFCIFWLPFSVGFMSIFLGNVAAFYIRLSDKNIERIERRLRRRLKEAKDEAERERTEVLKRAYRGQHEMEVALGCAVEPQELGPPSNNQHPPNNNHNHHNDRQIIRNKFPPANRKGFDMIPTNDGDGDDDASNASSHTNASAGPNNVDTGRIRRQRIIDNSNTVTDDGRPRGQTMQSMKDVVSAVRRNLSTEDEEPIIGPSALQATIRDSEFMSIRSTRSLMTSAVHLRRQAIRKPSFALRVLVQERYAEIIATDIAGFQSSVEIKENTLSVTIDTLKETADKWLIPRRARKAFRAVAFEALYFVGEHGLITRGADALYDLSPFEFHGLFSPLLAAMGDAETMEGWLASTDILADVDLRRGDGTRQDMSLLHHQQQRQETSTTTSELGHELEEEVVMYGPNQHHTQSLHSLQ